MTTFSCCGRKQPVFSEHARVQGTLHFGGIAAEFLDENLPSVGSDIWRRGRGNSLGKWARPAGVAKAFVGERLCRRAHRPDADIAAFRDLDPVFCRVPRE